MAFQITAQAATLLRKRLECAVADPINDIPGAVVCVVNKHGETIFSNAVGSIGAQSSDPMTFDTIFWLASCTKMLTGIACMQLVEQGILDLDNADQLDNLCPDLKKVQVVTQDEDGTLRYSGQRRRITLRMLLSHTAGFGYAPYSHKLRDWVFSHSNNYVDFNQPLIAQPGEDWNYGFNIEWVTRVIERITGLKVNDYLQRNVFDPLELKNTTFLPDEDAKTRLAKMNHRSLEDNSLREGPHFMSYVLDIKTEKEKDEAFINGGGGCFSTPEDYCRVIATLLNRGTSPNTGAQLLKPSTVDMAFENQIPQFPNFARKGMPAALPHDTCPISELFPAQPHSKPQGWGLTFMLTLEPTLQGRGPSTACWSGMANCYWWADRHNGVGGFIATQIVPFADPTVLRLVSDIESIVYSGRQAIEIKSL